MVFHKKILQFYLALKQLQLKIYVFFTNAEIIFFKFKLK